MNHQAQLSSGVQELINRLKAEGIQSGQMEANKIIELAQHEAAQMMAQAREETERMRDKARKEIDMEKRAAEQALHLAVRDSEIKLETELKSVFTAHVRRLVSLELQDHNFLKQMIMAIALKSAAAIPENQGIDITIANELFEEPEGTELSSTGKQRLRHFLLAVSSEMLREGVEVQPTESAQSGIRIQLRGEDLEIDLTEKAISELLLKHLAPRFRAVIRGIE